MTRKLTRLLTAASALALVPAMALAQDATPAEAAKTAEGAVKAAEGTAAAGVAKVEAGKAEAGETKAKADATKADAEAKLKAAPDDVKAKAGVTKADAEAKAKTGKTEAEYAGKAKADAAKAKAKDAAKAKADAAEAKAKAAQAAALSSVGTTRWPAFHVGASLGGHLVITDWGAATAEDDTGLYVSPGHSFLTRLRLGAQFTDIFAVEGSLTWLPIEADGESQNAFAYDVGALLFFNDGTWRPFFGLGVGMYHFPSGEKRDGETIPSPVIDESDIDPLFWYGLGLRAMATDAIALRADLRHLYTDGLKPEGPGIDSNFEVSVGVDFIWGGVKPAPVKDADGDGVADSSDRCVDVAGPASNAGCPPDKDGDGVLDKDDACIDTAGLKSLNGCPDADSDGIKDADDACPAVAGIAAMKGCPDADGDGITDADDRCPKIKGTADFKGCVDTDGDTVADPDDLCPSVKGPVDRKGCPPPPKEIKEQFSGSIEGILFETGSAELKAESQKTIDEAAAVLIKYGDLSLTVEGHTDSVGKAEPNKTLSQDRADAVKAALVAKGVQGDRITATGFGEEKPVASNRTKKGRAQNRRIEFSIAQPK